MVLCTLFVAAILGGLIWLFLKANKTMDCDLSLFLLERYGKPLSNLKGKKVWITGAASGIGEHLAYEMASHKCKLALCDMNQQGLERVKKKCINHYGIPEKDILVVSFNLTESKRHQEAFDKIIGHFKQIDIFFCNAGRSQRSRFEEIDIEVHREMFEINVFSGVNLSRMLLRHWYPDKYPGHIVVTASVAGKFGLPFSATYTASKHALLGYYDCLRNESRANNVKVTVICPGPTDSNILAKSYTGKYGETYGKDFASKDDRIPTSRQARMFAIATVNEVEEAWTSRPPYLWIVYGFQFLPTLSKRLFPIVFNEERLAKIRDG